MAPRRRGGTNTLNLRALLPLRKLIPRLKVRSKDGPVVRLEPHPEQVEILDLLETGEDVLVLKPRQVGASTIIAAYLLWLWLTSPHPITIVVLSYKQKSAKHLLKMVRSFYNNLPEALRLPLERDTQDHLILEGTGAELMAVGAKDDEGTRSFTANYIWLSEFAFLPHSEELLAAAAGSITKGGQMIAETTANHWDDAMHQEIVKVERGESDYRFKFFPWSQHPAYRVTGDVIHPTPEEQEWMGKHGLDLEQLAWWRRKVRKLGVDKARREFPLTVNDAYSQGAGQFFRDSDLDHLAVFDGSSTGTVRHEPYTPTHSYAAGFDSFAGIGLDASALTIFNATTGRVAATWTAKVHTVDEALEILGALCVEYSAVLAIEHNNTGHTYNQAIRELGAASGVRLWLDRAGKPWVATVTSRAKLWTDLKKSVQNGTVTGVDAVTLSDLKKVKVDEHERIVLPRTKAGHCDAAVSFALAVMASGQARAQQAGHFKGMLDKLKAQRLRAATQGHRRY